MPTVVSGEAHGDERGALLAFLEAQRGGLRRAALGLTDEQAARRTTKSELSVSGLIKHVAEVELNWLEMAQELPRTHQRTPETWHLAFQLVADETVAGTLGYWEQVAREVEKFVREVPSLDDTFPLPAAPWFPKDARRSIRWLVLHLIEEVARHAGHADIIRESLDGKTAFELVAEEAARGEQRPDGQ